MKKLIFPIILLILSVSVFAQYSIIDDDIKSTSNVKVKSVTLDQKTLTLGIRESETLNATVLPSDATNKRVTWSSSNKNVATVSSSGIVKGISTGNVTITVKTIDGGYTATCKVTVKNTTVKVTGVTLDQKSLTIELGKSETLNATVLPSDATNKRVTWTSSNTNIATVSSSGIVKGISTGNVTITVKTIDGGYRATCKITVKKTTVKVTSVTLDQKSLSLEVGESETLNATVLPSDATNKGVTWTSSNTNIATVSSSGIVKGISTGNVTITVKTIDGGYRATCKVTVKKTTVKVTSVTLDQKSLSLEVGESETLNATVLPSDATNKGVTWTSSNKNVATVSSSGIVKGISTGNVTITVKTIDGGYKATCKVTVKKTTVKVTSVTLDQTSLSISVGKTTTLTATVLPTDATNKKVTWSSSNKNVATVSSSGIVKGISTGNVTITVKTIDGGYKATCKVTVKEVKVKSVQLYPTTLSLGVNDTETLTATILPTNATNKNVSWRSSNANIVSVSTTGLIKGLKIGTAKITVVTKDGNYKATCTVTVLKEAIKVKSVTLNKKSLSIKVGKSSKLKATITPSNATNKQVTWSSSNANIASVSSSGVVKGIKAGTAIITVKTSDGGYTATCSVKVTE